MKKITFLGSVLFALLSNVSFSQNVQINEILSSNSAVNTDEDGDYSDWVELYNNSPVSVNLDGYGLSDDASAPYKWTFPSVEIAPWEHLLVWCSDKNRTTPGQPLHTNWKISADGETLTLTASDGTLTDQIPPIVLEANSSYGRTESGSADFSVFTTPTPGEPNAQTSAVAPDAPSFSVPSGMYSEAFDLNITHTDPTVTILYTLDGSEPKPENIGGYTYVYKNQYREFPESPDGELIEGNMETFVYSVPLDIHDRSAEPNDIAGISTTNHQFPFYIPTQPIAKSTVVRACAVKNGLASATVTANYFVGLENPASLPVVSINTNEDGLFDYYTGIHVSGEIFDEWRDENPELPAISSVNNYQQSGDAWEIRANFSLFDNQSQVLSQDIGMRINGGYTRTFANKSLRLYARSEYGASNFNYPVFGNDYGFGQFKRLILRNGGNDAYGAYLRDAFIQRSVRHLNAAHQPYRPAIVFMNGEYWGLLDFRERYDDKYFDRVFGIDSDDLDFLEYDGYLIQEGNNDHYVALLDYLNNNSLSDNANFEYVNTQMDVDNYTDYFVANVFADNTDWPHNNVEFWRKRTAAYEPDAPYGQDGRWRWVFKDMDFGFGIYDPEAYQNNTLIFASTVGAPDETAFEWSTFLIRKLFENNDYKNHFINRFADLLNTTFLPERLNGIFNEMKSAIAPEIPRQAARWQTITPNSWQNSSGFVVNFINQRPSYQRQHIQERFNIESQVSTTIDVNDTTMGFVKINTIELAGTTVGVAEQPYPWSGIYFKNIPITLKAIPLPGYEFSHWSGASESPSDEIVIYPQEGFSITAHFSPINTETETIISYWLPTTALPSVPLQTISSSYEIDNEGTLTFVSCYEGYPFSIGHSLYGKGALTLYNSPTDVNYQPEANDNIPFEEVGNMRALSVRAPFAHDGNESALIFEQSTLNFENIYGKFAAKTTGTDAPTHVKVDYSISPDGEETWTTEGMPVHEFELSTDYDLFHFDCTEVYLANNNPDFKIRIRFVGSNLDADGNARVVFNNISISGQQSLSVPPSQKPLFKLYPNPTTDVLYVAHDFGDLKYEVYSSDGRLVRKGDVIRKEMSLFGLQSGIYLVKLDAGQTKQTYKVVKY